MYVRLKVNTTNQTRVSFVVIVIAIKLIHEQFIEATRATGCRHILPTLYY